MPFKAFCTAGSTKGSGVTTLIKKNPDLEIKESETIFTGHAYYVRVEIRSNIFHVYNVLIPQDDTIAFKTLCAIEKHCSQHRNGVIVYGGDFNCTLNPSLDRFHQPKERRHKIASALKDLHNTFSLCDVWRRRNPDTAQFTWFRGRPDGTKLMSKARLDRFYVPIHLMSSVFECDLRPCSLSDHSAVTMKINIPRDKPKGSAFWHFNNSLLQDESYKHVLKQFWSNWQSQKADFNDLCSWWDMGKIHIKSITQMYGTKAAREKRDKISSLQKSIDELQSTPDITPDTKKSLKEQRESLNDLYRHEAQGALIRARFQYTHEIDTCSTFFFNMEKSSSTAKNITRIRLQSGNISNNPDEIKSHTRNFYKELYSKTETHNDSFHLLVDGLPTLSQVDSEDCDKPIQIEQMDIAVHQLNNNKSPGLDGLTSEFYQAFWPILREDLMSVLNFSIASQRMPISCRRGVITLLPKKGDLLDISNWRPVSSLNTDYKIFAKILANRLKTVIDTIVHPDQSYSVPGRDIHDNMNLIKDALMYANSCNIPLAVLNLDQKKAFDNVDHQYLFKVLKTMGFGECFISYLKILYNDSQSLLKVCGSR